ncbi:hypothetical protein [Accumulibacter sp.]|uniref:hypothetical protein n=1 Tax=Accumulibacter sp. TaxID=2053492 RepID=UPI00258BC38B|nr:hypothetical protein [Accumulibacter sp.]
MEDLIFDDTPAAETAAPVEAEAPELKAQEPAVEQQEAEQQQESEREVVRKKKAPANASRRLPGRATKPNGAQQRQSGNWQSSAPPSRQTRRASAGKPALDQFRTMTATSSGRRMAVPEAVRAALSANRQKTQAAAQAAQNKQRTESGAKAQTAVRPGAARTMTEVISLSESLWRRYRYDPRKRSWPRGGLLPCATPRKPSKSTDSRPSLPPEQSAGLKHRSRNCRCSSKDQQSARTDQAGQRIVVRTHWHIG